MDIAEALRERRDQWGMPVAELSRRSGVSREMVYRVLTGRTKNAEIIGRVARALDVKLPEAVEA